MVDPDVVDPVVVPEEAMLDAVVHAEVAPAVVQDALAHQETLRNMVLDHHRI
jgi:hypothetical protein